MRFTHFEGVVQRRIVVNYRVDPEVIRPLLPSPFRPMIRRGWAIAGIVLTRLEKMRPQGWPAVSGVASENAEHFFAVEWDIPDGSQEGHFIARRDTNSLLKHYAGGTVVPGEAHYADFEVKDSAGLLRLRMRSGDRKFFIGLRAGETADWAAGGMFESAAESLACCERCGTQFSMNSKTGELTSVRITNRGQCSWALRVEIVKSAFFNDRAVFRSGSVEVDSALVMRGGTHEWEVAESARVRVVGGSGGRERAASGEG